MNIHCIITKFTKPYNTTEYPINRENPMMLFSKYYNHFNGNYDELCCVKWKTFGFEHLCVLIHYFCCACHEVASKFLIVTKGNWNECLHKTII